MLAIIQPIEDAYDLTELPLFEGQYTIDLKWIDYEYWIKQNRDWFKREFPWIFCLKDALSKEGIDVYYPKLLLESGEIWQFAYPEVPSYRIHIFDLGLFLKVVSDYDFDKQWLSKHTTVSKYVTSDSLATRNRFTGPKALEKWINDLKEARKSPNELDSNLLFYSLHASVYLENTRILAWFAIKEDQSSQKPENKAKLLSTLQGEVNIALNCKQLVIKLLTTSLTNCSTDYEDTLEEMLKSVEDLLHYEKTISDWRENKK